MATQEFTAAIKSYETALRIDASLPAEVHSALGQAYNGRGLREKSIQDFGKAIEHAPDYAEPFKNRGLALLSAGDDAGLDDIEVAARLKPEYGPEIAKTLTTAARDKAKNTLVSGPDLFPRLDSLFADMSRVLLIEERLGLVNPASVAVSRSSIQLAIPVGAERDAWLWNQQGLQAGAEEYSWWVLIRYGDRVLRAGVMHVKDAQASESSGSIVALLDASSRNVFQVTAAAVGTRSLYSFPRPGTNPSEVTALMKDGTIYLTVRDRILATELSQVRPEIVIAYNSGTVFGRLGATYVQPVRVSYSD